MLPDYEITSAHSRHYYLNSTCELDDALRAEGLASEIVNRVQKTRKEHGFNVDDRISIHYEAGWTPARDSTTPASK
ncbi:MAG: DUF5915 domain-containing protein [Saccharospirillum sp.]|nr:DUF5915 domain-containing protein [Saccharospirillum sp.]